MKNAALSGKPYAGNPHVRFDEGEVVSYPLAAGRSEGVATRGAKPGQGSLLYKQQHVGQSFVGAGLSAVMTVICGVVSAETMALYPFTDGAVGESAVGVTLMNAADSTKYAGSASTTDDGTVTFSDVVPGKYVFEGAEQNAKLVAGGIQSVYMPGKNATIELSGLASDLVSAQDWTLEFFYMVPKGATDFTSWSPQVMKLPVAISEDYGGGTASWLCCSITSDGVFACFDSRSATGAMSYSYKANNGGWLLNDGIWHHVAVQHTNDKARLICDYNDAETVASYKTLKFTTPQEAISFFFANGLFKGYIACPRFSTEVLPTARLLRATDEPTYYPETVVHWSFEGGVGTDLAAQTNCYSRYPAYHRALTNQFYWAGNATRKNMVLAMTGRATTVSANDQGQLPAYAEQDRKHRILSEGEEAFGRSETAMFLKIGKGCNTWYNSSEVSVDATAIPLVGGDFTAEGYFRFDTEQWKDDFIDKSRPRVSLLMQSQDVTAYAWYLNFYPESKMLQFGMALKGGATATASFNSSEVDIADGAWHHVAAAYERATGKVAVYVDHNQVLDNRIEQGAIAFSSGTSAGYNTFRVGKLANGHPFPGWVDEVRFSRSVLPVSRFLKLTREPTGMMLILR